GADRGRAEHHRLQSRAADLVDGGRADPIREPSAERGLAGGRLAGPGLDDLAHEDLVDLLRGNPGALDRRANGDGTELRRRHGREPATELADWRAGGGEDECVAHAGHGTAATAAWPGATPCRPRRR